MFRSASRDAQSAWPPDATNAESVSWSASSRWRIGGNSGSVLIRTGTEKKEGAGEATTRLEFWMKENDR